MQVRRLVANQVHIVQFDEIPLLRLVQKDAISRFATLFEFQNVEVAEDAGNVVVRGQVGVFRSKDVDHPIVKIVIEARRILIEVEGATEIAHEIYSNIRDFLAVLANQTGDDFLKPIVTADESEVIAQLELSADQLVAPLMQEFISNDLAQAASSDFAKAQPRFLRLQYAVQYDVEEPNLEDYRISLVRKEFSIGARPGFPLKDRIFHSKAPLDSSSHLALLETLEKNFQNQKAGIQSP